MAHPVSSVSIGFFIVLACSWLTSRSDDRKWLVVVPILMLTGVFSNRIVMAANQGLMPVLSPVALHGHWKVAAPTDHLLLLCDRIPLWPITIRLGELLTCWSVTSGFGYSLMSRWDVASIGDILIFAAVLLWMVYLAITRTSRMRRTIRQAALKAGYSSKEVEEYFKNSAKRR